MDFQNRLNTVGLLYDKDMKQMDRGASDEMISENGNVILVKCLDNRSFPLASNFVSCDDDY